MRTILAIALFALVAACGGSKKPAASPAPATEAAPAEAEKPAEEAPAEGAAPDADKASADPDEGGEAK